jgi:hypothetical protein
VAGKGFGCRSRLAGLAGLQPLCRTAIVVPGGSLHSGETIGATPQDPQNPLLQRRYDSEVA